MTINYKQEDLFAINSVYAHCISRDYKMMKGIALQFNHKFDMKNKLKKLALEDPSVKEMKSVPVDGIFNLITKNYYYQKPTIESLKISLLQMKEQLGDTKYIRMPLIGCGLDKLVWKDVEKTLREVFGDLDLTIDVCYLEKERWKVRDFI